jgi:hypothetical protein
MTDGSACPAQCENGACTGACKNGATQCDSSDTLQTCNNGQWGPSMSCKYACVQNECGGECSPGDAQCASGTERQTCGQTGQWGDKKPCDFVCTDNKCDGECRPNDRKCKNTTQEKTCNAQGLWQDGATCEHVCTNNACGGDCDPGETRCKSSSQVEVCSDQGKWQTSTCPDGACVGDACATCQPGALDCTSNTEYVECNAQGEWGTAKKPCKNACVADKCDGVCIPGTKDTKCDHSSGAKQATRVCGEKGTWENVTCSSSQSCVKGECGSFNKRIFITKDLLRPVGGLAGLDQECNESAAYGGLSGTFKAFVIDSKTDVFKRFSMEGGPFRTPSGTLVAFNWDQLINGDLRELIDEHEALGKDIPPAVPNPTAICSGATTLVWGNIMKGGGIVAAEAVDNCHDFTTSAATGRAYFGDYSSKTKWRYSCGAAAGCGTRAHLICVEQ